MSNARFFARVPGGRAAVQVDGVPGPVSGVAGARHPQGGETRLGRQQVHRVGAQSDHPQKSIQLGDVPQRGQHQQQQHRLDEKGAGA